ncbi:MAG TPA: response regulator, partial [Planctomycetota bacterium]|nr:response regulator [Planctomycetota bacterium]
MSPKAKTTPALEALKRDFASRRGDRVRELRELLQKAGDSAERDALRQLRTALHKLAGSAGILGFPATGELAREGERAIDRELDSSSASIPASVPDLVDRISRSFESEAGVLLSAEPLPAADAAEPPRIAPVAVIVPGASGRVEALERELMSMGYTTRLADPADVERACVATAAALVDVDAGGDGYELCARIAAIRGGPRVRILYSDGPSAFDLLKASKARADRLIHRASDLRTVLGATSDVERVAARVLSVEDDAACGRAIEEILRAVGHVVRVLDSPAELLELLTSFRPDLLLLDCDLPQIQGFDLARVVRSDARHEAIPIVFVTTR